MRLWQCQIDFDPRPGLGAHASVQFVACSHRPLGWSYDPPLIIPWSVSDASIRESRAAGERSPLSNYCSRHGLAGWHADAVSRYLLNVAFLC